MNKENILIRTGIISAIICASIAVWMKFGFTNIFSVFLPSIIISFGIVWTIRNHLWKMPVFKYFLGNVPNLNGRWKVKTLRHGDKESHNMDVEIIQRWDNITLHFDGDRVISNSTLTCLEKEKNCFRLEYMWTGRFKQEYTHKGDLDGAAIVRCNEDASQLTGKYWTYAENNSTIGSMEFIRNK